MMAEPANDIRIHVEDTDREEDKLNQLIKLCRDASTREDSISAILTLKKPDDRVTLLDTKNKEGTTALHEACCYGNTDCVKAILKNGGCANIWDIRGFTPLHCAAYNGHLEAIKFLLGWTVPSDDPNRRLTPDEMSEFGETPLHIACMGGHMNVAKHLTEVGADKCKVDGHENCVFHYAASSNNGRLLMWLIDLFGGSGNEEMKRWLRWKNKFGQTPAHRAAILGCVMSISVIIQYIEGTIFRVKDNQGHTAIDLADILGNRECKEIANGKKPPKPLPRTPPTHRGSISLSMESLSVGRRDSLLQPQRSLSNGDSAQSTSSSTSPTLKRRNSTTRSKRPVNFGVPSLARNPSFQSRGSRAGSISSRLSNTDNMSRSSIDLENLNFVTVRKDTAEKVSLKKQDSTWEETTQLMFDSTTYQPPIDISFVPPIERDTLTRDKPQMFSRHHDIKLRISKTYWIKDNLKDEALETCLCAAMSLNQSYPQGYVIVSPICFASCKSSHMCEISLSLPHALREGDATKLCVLSASMGSSRHSAGSPLFSPNERTFVELPSNTLKGLEHQGNYVIFQISMHYPCLFALAVNIKEAEEGVPRPLVPLRCVLYVRYPVMDRTRNFSRVSVTSYVGLALKTVMTDMTSRQSSKPGIEDAQIFSKPFLMDEPFIQVSGSLGDHHDNWELWSMGDEEQFKYNEIALTQDLGNDSYSYQQPYPPQQVFFLLPKNPTRAIKCKIAVADSKQELASVMVIPYAPLRESTPEPSPLSSQPSSTHSSLTLIVPPPNSHETVV